MSVEEVSRLYYNPDVYFTSSVNIQSRAKQNTSTANNSSRKRLAAGSYNLASIESNLHGTALTEDLVEEKNSTKRFNELDRENYNENARIDLPKTGITFDYPRYPQQDKQLKIKTKQSAQQQLRKILASRRGIDHYLNEDEKHASILHTILSKRKNVQLMVPNKKLCSICGDNSPGSCTRCGARICSVSCFGVHNETRCTGY